MTCPRCRHANPPQAKYCLECGGRLVPQCARCGTELPAGAKFCLECGQAAAAPAAAPARYASPDSYTPTHLAERILTSKAALEGERKQVTVLFADLKGSLELLADRDPEEARRLLDPLLERMMEAVHRYEGTVNQVMGDGIMALFGAPVAHEDHAVRACYAALDMQAAVRRHAEQVRRTHGLGGVAIRVGLNSGEVVVRAIGSDLRMDYTAVGQTTHLAARMEQLADPGATLLTADTLRLTEGFVAVKPLGPIPIRGLAAPLEVYDLTGAGPLRSRLHAAAARGLTRFVGREGELEQLRQALGRVAAGHGQVVAIVGEPGVGKSRLVWEVTHSHRTHGWLIVQAGSVSYGKATPYLPVIDLLKGYFQIEDRDDQRKVREKVIGKLLGLDRALEPTLPAVLALLEVPVEDTAWQAIDPPQRRQRTLDALRRLLLREARVQPLLAVFEDLHWIDSETQAVLDSLVESAPTARLLVLVNYRPEYEHRWGSKTSYTQLRLDPLPPESAGELLDALLGPDPSLHPLKPLLIERTGGNPFFLEESVRTLVETGALAGERGGYRLAQPLPAVRVPATVQAVLAARIDRLPSEEKRLLQTAAVVGKDVPFVLLQAIAELPEAALRRGLARLLAAEFLYETTVFPEPEYTFKHALTHEVAYGSLLQDRRRALHARIVDTLERLYPDRLAEHVERLGYHAARGEMWEQAVTYLQQAGRAARAKGAFRDAAAAYEQGLAAAAHLPETPEAIALGIDLRLDLRNVLTPLGEEARIREHLRDAEAMAERFGDRRRHAWTLACLAQYHYSVAEHPLGVAVGRRAVALADGLDDLALRMLANLYLGYVLQELGDYQEAMAVLANGVGPLDPGGSAAGCPWDVVSISARAQERLARCHAEIGAFPAALRWGDHAVRLADPDLQVTEHAQCIQGLGFVFLCQGQLARATALLQQGLALSRLYELNILIPGYAALLGLAHALAGRLGEGLELAEEGAAASRRVLRARRLVILGEVSLLAGRPAAARDAAHQALRIARERGERGYEAYALRLLGEVVAHGDPPAVEPAEAHFRDARALAAELGMRPLLAHCHLGLGTLYGRTGDRVRAGEHLATAMAMYREMDMGFWLERAEAEAEPGSRGRGSP
jgi:class 3 adenylate cyclase/tetratricopeptide (TPR) repeat protein